MAGDRYPELLRTSTHRWWRPLLGLLFASLCVLVGSVALILAALSVAVLSGGSEDLRDNAFLDPDSPAGLLVNNLIIATLIPACLLAVLVVHRQHPGELASVAGRVRWKVLGRLILLALVLVTLFFVGGFAIPPAGLGDVDVPPAGTLVGLLAVVLFTTPLQSAAEEVGFRGYLSQAVASWFARPVVGAIVAGAVSATLFALAHGGQGPALFTDRFAFGVVASVLVWRTGGLEASIGLHVANNLVSLGYTAATSSIEESLETSALDWPYAALDVTMMVVYAVLVARLATRWNIAVRRPPAAVSAEPQASYDALSAPEGVRYPGSRSTASPPPGQEHPWGMG
ncbi:MAG: CPBP family intramembrane metalloprotease [Geodermatophilaceae bacterium]|nr:CPBP family intramembrane metalloprotease [Geodermatophilaceae bacterium]